MPYPHLTQTKWSFYSKLVRLEGKGKEIADVELTLGFYSKLVRLEGWQDTFGISNVSKFLFQTGAIRRHGWLCFNEKLSSFYSKLVRLEGVRLYARTRRWE